MCDGNETADATAIKAGGTNTGEPAVRIYIGPGYYAANVADFDGNRLESAWGWACASAAGSALELARRPSLADGGVTNWTDRMGAARSGTSKQLTADRLRHEPGRMPTPSFPLWPGRSSHVGR